MRNDINISPINLIFNFIIEFIRYILSPTILMMNLKLNCMKMFIEYMCIISHY